VTEAGRAFTGQVSTTSTGKQCQSWSASTPHAPNAAYTDESFSDGSLVAAENFCRNPDEDWHEGVWCYTMDPSVEWESCDVPLCGMFINSGTCFFIWARSTSLPIQRDGFM